MRTALAILVMFAASAQAQTPPKPAVAKPVTAKPAMAAAAKPAVPIETLRADLATVNAKIASHEEAQKQRDRLARAKGAISGMNMDDMLALQQMMDRKAELEKMISDAMKTASE